MRQEESIVQRNLAQIVVPAGSTAMSRAQQQTARAAGLDDEFFGRRVTLRDQVFCGGDKVCKRIALLFHAARIMPRLSQLSAAANVRDGIDGATVQQT